MQIGDLSSIITAFAELAGLACAEFAILDLGKYHSHWQPHGGFIEGIHILEL